MVPIESVSVSRGGSAHPGGHSVRTVVWLRGEHDIATRVHLSVTLAQAARLDDADMIVDLSGVTFMDASTIGAMVAARNHLLARARSLSVRAPSPDAWRLLEVCGLAGLVDEHSATRPPASTALGSWVDVPARERGPDSGEPPVDEEAPSQEAECATVRRGVEPSVALRQPRAPS